jgi:two-component system chemotaxis response regulator CheB
MSACPTPIVIVTGKMDPKDSATLFRVMEAGALMITAKPFPPGHPEHGDSVRELIKTVKLMSEIKVVRRSFPGDRELCVLLQQVVPTETAAGIGCSHRRLHGRLAASAIHSLSLLGFQAPVAIVQHMAKGLQENSSTG